MKIRSMLAYWPYILFILAMLAFNALIFATPFIAFNDPDGAPYLYLAFAPTCHQLTSRSLCIFRSESGFQIADCYENSGVLVLSKEYKVERNGMVGYKIPVCARDVAIYLAMLIGGLLFPLYAKPDSEKWPNKWLLVLALIPIAIDGTSQLLGMRESTNALRIFTGVVAGIAIPFYLIPILNAIAHRYLPKIK